MLLIPAIDLKNGQCVQLKQGVMDSASIYSDDPVAMSKHWRDAGARRIHVVDLDGAFAGVPRNRDLVEAIVEAVAPVPVEIGGGIRDRAIATSYLDAGVAQVIIGTAALEDPDFFRALVVDFPGRVILGLDAREGRVATRGWDETSDVLASDLARSLCSEGVFAVVFTDVARDGMLTGVNAEATAEMAEAVGSPIIASGGVKSLDDLERLVAMNLPSTALLGAITGSALYEGTLDFAAGQALLDHAAGEA